MSKLTSTTIFIFTSFFLISHIFSKPASNEQLDKATINDIAINSISEEKKSSDQQHHTNNNLQLDQQQSVPSTIEITGISTGISNPVPAHSAGTSLSDSSAFKPPKTGSMFARFIDDIFQIPITVLQNVARLITGPFIQSKKESST